MSSKEDNPNFPSKQHFISKESLALAPIDTTNSTTTSTATSTGSRNRRRLSVDDSVASLIGHIHRTKDRLKELWDIVHLENRHREARTETAYAHVHQLLDDMVISEEEMVKGLESDIHERRLAISNLREMLGLKSFFEGDHPKGSVALMRALDKELKKLYAKRDEAVSHQLAEYRRLSHFCHRLGIDPPRYDDLELKILALDELRKLKQVCSDASLELNNRFHYISELQSRAKRMHEALRGDVSFTAEEENILNTNYSDENSIISQEAQTFLHNFCERLKDSYDAWVENTEFRYDEMILELQDLLQKLNITDHTLNAFPAKFDPDFQTQTDLAELRNEVLRLNLRYENGMGIYDQLRKWKGLWQEKNDLERMESCSEFYNNRGGCINDHLKRKKQLGVEVPKALEALKEKVKQHIESGANIEDILVNGMTADQYAESLMVEYEMRKLAKKNSAKLTPRERANGVRKRSMSCSKLSAITPTRTQAGGPINSTPRFMCDFSSNSAASTSQIPRPGRAPLRNLHTYTNNSEQPSLGQTYVKQALKTVTSAEATPLIRQGTPVVGRSYFR